MYAHIFGLGCYGVALSCEGNLAVYALFVILLPYLPAPEFIVLIYQNLASCGIVRFPVFAINADQGKFPEIFTRGRIISGIIYADKRTVPYEICGRISSAILVI